MIKIARYNQEQKRFEIESTGCEDMDALVDSGHEALHTRERIKLFNDSVETEKDVLLDLYLGLPHARGGVSKESLVSPTARLSSPRPWGCFQYGYSLAV